jgi:hypothetical protein
VPGFATVEQAADSSAWAPFRVQAAKAVIENNIRIGGQDDVNAQLTIEDRLTDEQREALREVARMLPQTIRNQQRRSERNSGHPQTIHGYKSPEMDFFESGVEFRSKQIRAIFLTDLDTLKLKTLPKNSTLQVLA